MGLMEQSIVPALLRSQATAGTSAQLLALQDLLVEWLLPLFVCFLGIWLLRVSRYSLHWWLCDCPVRTTCSPDVLEISFSAAMEKST